MTRPEPAPDHVTPYDRLSLPDAAVEQLLASGEHAQELADFFGEHEYRELVRLARRAERAAMRGPGTRVYILPGIMGSQLGRRRSAPWPDDILWLDPIDIAFGRLALLRVGGSSPVVPLGAVLYTYLRLKLHLRAAGFAPVLHDYDWRLGVDTLGRAFAARLREENAAGALIVAHSMGGLVARAALAHTGADAVTRVLLLGTPNGGSFAAVQALRGTYAVVRKIARLDLRHSAETLAQEVFSTFPSLYQLLPAPERSGGLDLSGPDAWPESGPRPRPELLHAARGLGRELPPPDARLACIVGVNQETVTAVAREADDFRYTITRAGDGTVPIASAVLAGTRTYFTAVAHSELARDPLVAAAVVDLLRHGTTRRLPLEWPRGAPGEATISDAELRATHLGKVDLARLAPAERRAFLQNLNEPPTLELRVPGAARTPAPRRAGAARRPPPSQGGSARRRAQERRRPVPLEIRVEVGDIAAAREQALAAAVFQDVRPAGAIAAIDARLEGLIEELAARRMLPGEAGGLLAVPARGRLPHAGQVVLAGLGRFDRLAGPAIELAAENVARLCVRSGLHSLATVLWGSGSGFAPADSCAHQLCGYLRALAAADPGHTVRRIVFRITAASLRRRLLATCRRVLAGAQLPGRRLVLHERPPAQRVPSRVPRAAGSVPRTVYLLVQEHARSRTERTLHAAVLSSGRHAAVVSESRPLGRGALRAHLRRLPAPRSAAAGVVGFGGRLAALTLHARVRAALHEERRNPLVVVHDAAASRIPWETLCIRRWFPALGAGLSRRFTTERLAPARFSAARRRGRGLAALVVADPTGDLPAAAREAAHLAALLRPVRLARVTLVRGREASRARLLAELQSGAYDLLHFAGHAVFDPRSPGRSGLRCSDGVLSGIELGEITRVPALVVFSACESGRLHGAAAGRRSLEGRARAGHGLAEVLLRAGVASYVGTARPVGDLAALAFAEAFYGSLLQNAPIGAAVLAARCALRERRAPGWADYIHYGDPDFTLEAGTRE